MHQREDLGEAGSADKLNDPEFVQWLRRGDIEFKSQDESRVHFAKKVRAHMGTTISYSFSPTAQQARRSVAEIVRLGKTDCGGSTYVFCAALARQGIPVRTTLNTMHIFPEMYVEGTGWVPCEGTELGDSLGRCGYVMSVGAPAVLDLSPVGGPSSQLALSQWPLTYGTWPSNAWKGGRNEPCAVPNNGGTSEE